jgi:hypothetical protein
MRRISRNLEDESLFFAFVARNALLIVTLAVAAVLALGSSGVWHRTRELFFHELDSVSQGGSHS